MAFNELTSSINRGIALYQRGQYAEAESAFNTFLKAHPHNVNASHLLALSIFNQGRPHDAEHILNSAIKRHKKISKLHTSLGQILEAQGKLDGALASFKTASKLEPNNEWIHINKGIVFGKLNKINDAISSIRSALKINHKNVTALANLGQLLWRQGNNKAAKKTLNQALELQPNFVQALAHLGAILFSEGNLDDAEQYLRRAHTIGPPHPEVLYNLTGVLLAKEDMEALFYCDKAVELLPNHPSAYLYLGRAFELVAQWDEAVAAYSHALQLQPDFKLASIGLANAKMNFGQFDNAIALCWKEINKDPHFLEAYSILLQLEEPDKLRDTLDLIEQIYRKREDSDPEKIRAAFSLARFYERDAQYDKSFGFLMAGNRLKRSTYKYDLEEDRAFINKIQYIFNKKFIDRSADYGSPDNTPIFILGMPRSGTSLIEQILASHPQVFGAGELQYIKETLTDHCKPLSYKEFPEAVNNLQPDAYRKMASWYLEAIKEMAEGALRITDKLPHNFLHVGIIHILFPKAKIIHCKRNPIDNCLSIFKQNFIGQHRYSNNLSELGHYYILYNDLMRHWHKVLPGLMLDLQYEDMVADQEGTTQRLLKFCDLPWDDNCLNFHKTQRAVLTSSQRQVRREIYTNSVKLWQRYEEQLQPLINVLQAGNTI